LTVSCIRSFYQTFVRSQVYYAFHTCTRYLTTLRSCIASAAFGIAIRRSTNQLV
jgi:hypothetical protein